MYCTHCGQDIDDNAMICPHCGVPTKNMQQQNQPYGAQSYGNQPYGGQPNYGVQPKKTNGSGIAGFVVSLVGMLGGNYLFLIPGIIGLVFSIIGVVKIKKCNSCNGLAIAGLVISIISCIFWLIVWIIAFGMIISGEVPIY